MSRHDTAQWNQTNGSYLTGQAYIDEADKTAWTCEQQFGVGRLRLLVGAELRAKFDRQRFKWNSAIEGGDLETLRVESQRMCNAWRALYAAAEAAGAFKLSPLCWETTLDTGELVALVRDDYDVAAYRSEGRKGAIYTLDEIGRFLRPILILPRRRLSSPAQQWRRSGVRREIRWTRSIGAAT